MAETIIVDKNKTIDEQYQLFLKQIKNLLDKNENLITNLANCTAALKQTFEKVSWVGFYLFDGSRLYLGPFQGKVACTSITIGKGVCGTAAAERKSIVVPDVEKFPGHIFCDVDSRSEIVVPIIKDARLIGVIDLDSTSLSSFDETDKKYLEELCSFLADDIFTQ